MVAMVVVVANLAVIVVVVVIAVVVVAFATMAVADVDVGVVVPVNQKDVVVAPADAGAWLASHADAVAGEWRDKLDRVDITVSTSAQPIVDTMKSGVAQILISRDGPALQPGTRSYSRTWVRDGAMMLEGLLRTGHEDVASAFIRW